MKNITARSVPADLLFSQGLEVVRVEYAPNRLVVYTQSPNDSISTLVEFSNIIAFRVMDERDLMEFWPECSSANGRLFEISAGGWLAQELLRPGSLIGSMSIQPREYFLTGVDDCVSVLCYGEPSVRAGTILDAG